MIEHDKMNWKVHTPNLLGEILNNPTCAQLKIPLNIFSRLLMKVATRASQLDDIELNKLMMRLSLYAIADPEEKDYNPEFVEEYCKKSEVG